MPYLWAGDEMIKTEEMKRVVAIVCADIHLSDQPPTARSGGPVPWFDEMERTLVQVRELAQNFNAPVLCAGDVFDKGVSASPALISFAMDALPPGMLCIPGQHDLPLHDMGEIQRSAYWTLVKSGTIVNVPPLGKYAPYLPENRHDIWVQGFGWNEPVTPCRNAHHLSVALVHAYAWNSKVKGSSYENVPPDSDVVYRCNPYAGYSVVVIGDNHRSWESVKSTRLDGQLKKQTIFNCGSLMRRSSDQAAHRPRVGLLRPDGTITSYYLYTNGEHFNPVDLNKTPVSTHDFTDLMAQLGKLSSEAGNDASVVGIQEGLRRAMDSAGTPAFIRTFVNQAIDHALSYKIKS